MSIEKECEKVFNYLLENGKTEQSKIEEILLDDEGSEVVRNLRHNDLVGYTLDRKLDVKEGKEFNHSEFKIYE